MKTDLQAFECLDVASKASVARRAKEVGVFGLAAVLGRDLGLNNTETARLALCIHWRIPVPIPLA